MYIYTYTYVYRDKGNFIRKLINYVRTNLARGKGRRCRNYPGKNSDVSTCAASQACCSLTGYCRTGSTSIGCCKRSTCSVYAAPTCSADDCCSAPGSCSWASAGAVGRTWSGTRAFEVNLDDRFDCSSRSYCISGSRGAPPSSWNSAGSPPTSPHHSSATFDYSLASELERD